MILTLKDWRLYTNYIPLQPKYIKDYNLTIKLITYLMMKKFFYLAVTLFALTACTSDSDVIESGIDKVDLSMTFSAGNQSRIVTPKTVASASKATRAATDPAAPSIPTNAIEFDKEALNNWTNGVQLSKGNTYKVTKAYEGSISCNAWEGTGEVNIYVAADADFTTWWGDWDGIDANIYVLPGATLTWYQAGWDQMTKIPGGTKIYVWGNLTTPDGYGLRLIDGSNNGGELYVYNGETPLTIKTANGDLNNVNFQVDSKAKFYSSREVIIEGTASFLGEAHFADKATISYNMLPGANSHVIFDKCAWVLGQLDDRGASYGEAVIDVNEYLYVGSLHDDSRNLTINLTEALFDIDNVFSTVQEEYRINRIVDKGNFKIVGKSGEYYSVIRMLKDGENTLYFDKGNDYTVEQGGDGTPVSFVVENITGYVTLYSVNTKVKIQYPMIEGKDDISEVLTFKDGNVHYNDGDVYLPATDCRPGIGGGVVIVSPDVQHKYSATGIDFGTDGTLYLCWHSNVNTNKEDGDEYSPSVENSADFGGIVDVIDVNTYDPTQSIFEQTMLQNEHKYNHVKYYNGKLYLATTSNKVGAALHELILSGSKISETAESQRVNLTGTSANAVDIVNNELVTISGYNNGGLNKFALNDYTNQEKKFINEASSEYQGKFVYMDKVANKVITLNNTSRGIVTIYNPSTMAVEKSFEVGDIYPTDGKNVCISDGTNIYICRGQRGFDIYDFNGNKVGGSKKHANGCDVDSKYIYVATGDGFAILDKSEKDAEGYNKTVKLIKFTGTGFVYPGVRGGKTDDSVKQSANYIKVKDGNVYVAYGMYGMRIYKLSDLITE